MKNVCSDPSILAYSQALCHRVVGFGLRPQLPPKIPQKIPNQILTPILNVNPDLDLTQDYLSKVSASANYGQEGVRGKVKVRVDP